MTDKCSRCEEARRLREALYQCWRERGYTHEAAEAEVARAVQTTFNG